MSVNTQIIAEANQRSLDEIGVICQVVVEASVFFLPRVKQAAIFLSQLTQQKFRIALGYLAAPS